MRNGVWIASTMYTRVVFVPDPKNKKILIQVSFSLFIWRVRLDDRDGRVGNGDDGGHQIAFRIKSKKYRPPSLAGRQHARNVWTNT